MINDPRFSGSKWAATAKAAALRASRSVGRIFPGLVLIILAGLPARAATFDVFTGIQTDLAINGPGYFVLSDPVTAQIHVTRLGELSVDAEGFLVTSAGMRVQGFSDPALTQIGDLQIDSWPGSNDPSSEIVSFEIQTNGCVVVDCSDGSSYIRGQVLLQTFQNQSALIQIWGDMFDWSAAAGPLPLPVPPGIAGAGSLLTASIEQLVPEVQLSFYPGPSQSFSQGILVPTGITTDLGIQGGGFFILRRTNDNALFATRAGGFYVDGAGYLVHYSGLRLQGYTNSALTSIGDMQIDPTGWPSSSNPALLAEDFCVDHQGVITEELNDGTASVRGQVLLQACSNPNLLTRTNFDLYPLVANGALWLPLAPPTTGNLGWVDSGCLELSQFDANLLAVRSNLNFFVQGPVTNTGVPSNLAICGNGFFSVRDPVANILYATRWGAFQLDSLGHLVTTNALRLQGFTNAGLTKFGDITVDTAGAPDPSLALASYFIDFQGNIWVDLSDGSEFLRGQVVLQSYRNIQGLSPAGNGLYSNLAAAIPLFTIGVSVHIPSASIQSGAVELLSGMPAPLQLLPPNGFRLFISNLGTGPAQVESSSDLAHWNVIGSVNPSDLNIAEFFDTSQATQKFYRVVIAY